MFLVVNLFELLSFHFIYWLLIFSAEAVNRPALDDKIQISYNMRLEKTLNIHLEDNVKSLSLSMKM